MKWQRSRQYNSSRSLRHTTGSRNLAASFIASFTCRKDYFIILKEVCNREPFTVAPPKTPSSRPYGVATPFWAPRFARTSLSCRYAGKREERRVEWRMCSSAATHSARTSLRVGYASLASRYAGKGEVLGSCLYCLVLARDRCLRHIILP